MKAPLSKVEFARDQILENVEIHDRIFSKYDERHGEIFNEIEQERLRSTLARAIAMVRTGFQSVAALDFGCGSGNLTRHLLGLGLNVMASDVSEKFLSLVRGRFPSAQLSTHRLNGTDLGELKDNSFDFVATYSVLHHVPDYLAAIGEMARVCKPGGVIYLDHEPTELYWSDDPAYARYKAQVSRFDWRKFLVLGNYVGKIRRIFNPRYANEGDIHVWPDDHVEWKQIEKILVAAGFEIALREDYLLFRRGYYSDVYERNKGALADMRVMVFRKL